MTSLKRKKDVIFLVVATRLVQELIAHAYRRYQVVSPLFFDLRKCVFA